MRKKLLIATLFAVLTLIYSRYIIFSSADTLVTRHLGTDLYGYFRMVQDHVTWLQHGFVGIANFWSPRGGGFPADTLEQIVTPANLLMMGIYSITHNFLTMLRIFDPLICFFTLLASYWCGTVLFKKTLPSIVLAVAYSFSLYGLGQLDHLDVLSAMIFVPLTVGCLERVFENGRAKYVILTALFMFLTLITQLYPFYFLLMFVCLRIVWELIRNPQRLKTLIASVKVAVLLVIAATPFFLAELAIAPLQIVRDQLNASLYTYAQVPGLYLLRSMPNYFVSEASVLYLGVTVVLLALIPIILKRWKNYTFYLLATLFFLLYSVGHYSPVNLAQLIHDHAPFAFFMRVPARALVVGCLTLAVCAAAGIEALIEKIKWKYVISAVVVIAIFCDLTIGYELPNTQAVAINTTAYEWISRQSGDFRILEIPSVYGQMNMTSLYTSHDTISKFVWSHGYYEALNAPAALYDEYISETATAEQASVFAIKYVVLNLDPAYYKQMSQALSEVSGPTLKRTIVVETWLNENSDYRVVFNQDNFVIFENLKYRGFIYGSGVVGYTNPNPNIVAINIDSATPTTVYISQSYDKNWKASTGTLAEQNSEQVLSVPAGKYAVTLRYAKYEKSLLWFLLYIPLIGVVVWMLKRKES